MALESLNKITLDVSTPLNIPVVRAVQEDIRSRYVEITLVSNGEPLVLPAGVTAIVGLRRANDTYVLYDTDEDNNPAVTFDGNKATVYLRQEAVAMAGSMYTTVTLFDGTNKHLSAFAFTLKVDQTAVPSDVIVESDYINIFQNELDEINTLLNNLSATATTLPAGSDATASYSDGVFSFGIPKGETGGVSEEEFEAGMASKAPVIVDTASGEIASIVDGADGMDARSLVVKIEPIQAGSGDPSPSNVRPISGRTGLTAYRTCVNVWDEEWELGTISSATGENSVSSTQIRSKSYTPVVPSESYSIVNGTSEALGFRKYGIDKSYLGYFTVAAGAKVEKTIDSNVYFLRFIVLNTTTYSDNISINYPSTDTLYHAYTGASYPVSWQSEAGTVYGGTLDVVGGLLTVTSGIYTPPENDVSYSSITGVTANMPAWADSSTYRRKAISTHFSRFVGGWAQMEEGQFQALNGIVGMRAPSVTSEAEAIAFIHDQAEAGTPVWFLFPLATPQTYQLTPTEVEMLLGVNNVFSDGGSVSLTYPCDTKLYIERLTQPIDDDMIANANIPAHQYFMVGNSLYYSTAAIAQGAAIVVGTNCVRVSLAEALNQLNS